MKLYDLTNQYQQLLAKLEYSDFADSEEIRNELESLDGSIEEKIKSTAAIVKIIEADKELIESEIKKLTRKKAACQEKIDWLRDNICISMQKVNLKKVENKPYFNVTLLEGQYKVHEFDPNIIPGEYKKVKETVTLDRIKMCAEMLEGVCIPGAQLVREKYITIR